MFNVLLATNRAGIQTFFGSLQGCSYRPLVISHIPVAVGAVREFADQVAIASVAIVDVGPDPNAAIEICQEIRQQRPDLSISALLCCPGSAAPWHVQALTAVGVDSLLDLQATGEQVVRALDSMARGDAVVHLQLNGWHGASLWDLFASPRHRRESVESDFRILELVALGLSDNEIGREVHLSPFTVRHHIERLRHELGARNRIELAAWAGRHGFYRQRPLDEQRPRATPNQKLAWPAEARKSIASAIGSPVLADQSLPR